VLWITILGMAPQLIYAPWTLVKHLIKWTIMDCLLNWCKDVYLIIYCVSQNFGLVLARLALSGIRTFLVPVVCPAESDRVEYYHHTYLQCILIVSSRELKVVRLDVTRNGTVWEYIYVHRRYCVISTIDLRTSGIATYMWSRTSVFGCLDISLNASKSMGIRIGPRHKHNCCELTTMDGHKIQWSYETRYIGEYLISSTIFSISLDNEKKSFYRAFKALFSKVGRVASEHVVVELLKTKCFRILLYDMEACPLTKTQINSPSYVISSSFRKIFNVSSNVIIYLCTSTYNCSNIEDILRIRKRTFLQKCCALDNIVCALCGHQAETELVSLETLT